MRASQDAPSWMFACPRCKGGYQGIATLCWARVVEEGGILATRAEARDSAICQAFLSLRDERRLVQP